MSAGVFAAIVAVGDEGADVESVPSHLRCGVSSAHFLLHFRHKLIFNVCVYLNIVECCLNHQTLTRFPLTLQQFDGVSVFHQVEGALSTLEKNH